MIERSYENQMRKINLILLAEDDADDQELFQDALDAVATDIKLALASDGVEAFNKLQEQSPDLVFLDLNMPLKNGYECLMDIKRDQQYKDLPVIIFSTSVQPDTAVAVYNSGASLYVVKPNNFGDLKNLLKKMLYTEWYIPMPVFDKEQFILRA